MQHQRGCYEMMKPEEIPILKEDGEIAIVETYDDTIIYAVKKGDVLILKKAKIKEK